MEIDNQAPLPKKEQAPSLPCRWLKYEKYAAWRNIEGKSNEDSKAKCLSIIDQHQKRLKPTTYSWLVKARFTEEPGPFPELTSSWVEDHLGADAPGNALITTYAQITSRFM